MSDERTAEHVPSTRAPVSLRQLFSDPGVDVAAVIKRQEPTQTGEMRFVRQLVEDAMREASMPPSQMRDDARAWLRDQGISARVCMESIGIDYDAAMKALERLWAQWDANPASRVKFTKRKRTTA